MTRVTLLPLIGVFAAAGNAMGQQPPTLEGFAAYVEKARADWMTPGVAITIVKDDRVVMARGFGVREFGQTPPVDEHTLFPLSSMGKAFAAAAVGAVIDEGLLEWDDPIVEHLPGFQMDDPWVTRHVTVRDMLAHRSGIGDETWIGTASGRDATVARTRWISRVTPFRTGYNYSNVGITVAGEAAARAAGVDWHTLIRTRVLQPLGMEASTSDLGTLWAPQDVAPCYLCSLDHRVGIEQARHPNLVMPHIWENGRVHPIPWRTVDNIAPAGSINANAVDMAKWLRMNLARGVLDGRRVLSEAVVSETHRAHTPIRPAELPVGAAFPEGDDRFHFWAYGLGWRMHDYRGHKVVWHTGGITGLYSIMALVPDLDLGISVLTNSWRASPPLLVYAVAFRAIDEYLGDTTTDWNTDLLAYSERVGREQAAAWRRLEAARATGTSPSLPLGAYAGRYQNPGHDDLRLSLRGARLFLEFPGGMTGALDHWHHDRFRVVLHPPAGVAAFATFTLDGQHEVAALDLQGFGQFRKVR